MNSVFSVEDLTDSFWQPPAPPLPPVPAGDGMARSRSEWAFQKLLEEISVSSGSPISASSATDPSPPPLQSEPSISRPSEIVDLVEIQQPQNQPSDPKHRNRVDVIDPEQYHAILKSKLDLACAAVALRVATVKPEDSSASSCNQKQPLPPTGSQTQSPVVIPISPDVSSASATPSLSTQNKSDTPVRQAASVSSRDDSDDEDLDGDTETTENADPADVKRARRMYSNRQSARRSRQRKQEQMNELDTQVGQLRVEHSTLLKRLSDMNHKYETAAVDNRILNADIETMRTKVKMAEETMKRLTGMNSPLLARSNIHNMTIPFNTSHTDSSSRRSLMSGHPNSKPGIPNITGLIPNSFADNNRIVHMAEQVNPFASTSCNPYETAPHWNRGSGKNDKTQE